jgi:hypothetical protein
MARLSSTASRLKEQQRQTRENEPPTPDPSAVPNTRQLNTQQQVHPRSTPDHSGGPARDISENNKEQELQQQQQQQSRWFSGLMGKWRQPQNATPPKSSVLRNQTDGLEQQSKAAATPVPVAPKASKVELSDGDSLNPAESRRLPAQPIFTTMQNKGASEQLESESQESNKALAAAAVRKKRRGRTISYNKSNNRE